MHAIQPFTAVPGTANLGTPENPAQARGRQTIDILFVAVRVASDGERKRGRPAVAGSNEPKCPLNCGMKVVVIQHLLHLQAVRLSHDLT
jgi:hypothetical protein